MVLRRAARHEPLRARARVELDARGQPEPPADTVRGARGHERLRVTRLTIHPGKGEQSPFRPNIGKLLHSDFAKIRLGKGNSLSSQHYRAKEEEYKQVRSLPKALPRRFFKNTPCLPMHVTPHAEPLPRYADLNELAIYSRPGGSPKKTVRGKVLDVRVVPVAFVAEPMDVIVGWLGDGAALDDVSVAVGR